VLDRAIAALTVFANTSVMHAMVGRRSSQAKMPHQMPTRSTFTTNSSCEP